LVGALVGAVVVGAAVVGAIVGASVGRIIHPLGPVGHLHIDGLQLKPALLLLIHLQQLCLLQSRMVLPLHSFRGGLPGNVLLQHFFAPSHSQYFALLQGLRFLTFSQSNVSGHGVGAGVGARDGAVVFVVFVPFCISLIQSSTFKVSKSTVS